MHYASIPYKVNVPDDILPVEGKNLMASTSAAAKRSPDPILPVNTPDVLCNIPCQSKTVYSVPQGLYKKIVNVKFSFAEAPPAPSDNSI